MRTDSGCGRVFGGLLVRMCLVVWLAGSATAHADDGVRFSRDVLPILAEKCFACHGPDPEHRAADLRLDHRDGALAAISLEHPSDSLLLQRVTSADPDVVMPPPSSRQPPLTAAQVAVLERWIAAGAPWGRHWALEVPVRPPLPPAEPHPVDAFVVSALQPHGVSLSPPAELYTLARRVSLDLTGLPPTWERVQALQRTAESVGVDAAYTEFVDELLQSPHFGERMAMWWLDAARYADTDGFQGDATRTNWPWRDWVVESFNANVPFDQLTIEQFAGDLLPEATPRQQLATAFHRHHMTNGEGGRDPEESRVDYVIDRVNSVGTVWLGITLGCCQCHSHKYDPISHHEYYALSAFFNSIDEDGRAGRAAKPYLAWESPYVERALAEARALRDQRTEREAAARQAAQAPFSDWVQARLADFRTAAEQRQTGWRAWQPLTAIALESTEGTVLQQEPDGTVQATGPHPNQDDYRLVASVSLPRITGIRLEILPHVSHTQGSYSRGRDGHFILTDVKVQVRQDGSSQVRDIAVAGAIADAADDPGKHGGYGDVKHILDDDPRNGWSTRDSDPHQPRTAVLALAEPLRLTSDEQLVVELRQRSTLGDASIGRFRVSVTDEAGPAVTSLGSTPLEQLAASTVGSAADLTPELRERLLAVFLADFAPYQAARAALERAQAQFNEVQDAQKVDVMVLAERPEPRVTHVLERGVWDKRGEVVTADVPAAIAAWPEQAPRTRLGLARWLMSRDNPLTSRVTVNHMWQLLFGAGLVRTPDDFGVQGERPTHPELLDWLAVDLQEHGWDLKRLLRLLVTSRTYRQQSHATPDLLTRDPENRWLARGPRYRLPSWMLRDAALSAAGLLNPALGGPPVRPYQPPGVWEEMFMGRFRYVPSDGDSQYRRTLYAFWRRAVAPTFLFDAAQRRVCEVRPTRTNTPLQALTLLNDASYLEAARALAEQAVDQVADHDAAARLQLIVTRVLLRPAAADELQVLQREYVRAVDWYRQQPQQLAQLLRATDPNQRFQSDPAAETSGTSERPLQLAGLTLVAGLVLNLDEAVTHE